MLADKLEQRQDTVLRLLRARDEEGMKQLFTHYGGALLTLIEPVIERREVAEEVLNDVLLKIWENVDSYDEGKSRLFTWMARIARNAAIDKVRSKAYREQGKTDPLTPVVTKGNNLSVTPTMEHIGVAKLLNHLDADHRAIINLLYLKDYTQSEAAEELGIPLGTIKTRSRRAITQLRTFLQSEMLWLALGLTSLISLFLANFGH
ncbi:RNA polymerase sigma factor [Neolewinella antarctica]|uniref:RNA polymerase sigma-70 factor (ECF subfamily) n=1 Tax=Neolewinella antarctica TaxID=442734 RepID=A0ABX0X6C8_9BACT|nr:sigma-70 family RNA polymerase sigma factor [Neolewinella antarctica]NJC24569.1 RNA polymerase sigma-70 factor (ECF subfamily) [Neolewinella antarctica]